MKNLLKNKTTKGIIIAVFLIIVLILLFLNKSEIYQPKTEKGLLNLLSQSGSAKGGDTVTTTPTPTPTPVPAPDPTPTPTPTPSTSASTPFIIRGKVITPGYETDWEEKLLRAPLFGQVLLEWDVTPANRLVNLYVSDCQIRRVNQNGEMREILVDKAGLSGTATVYVNHQNPLLLFARKSEGYLYGVYCRSAISPDVHYYGLVANKLLDTDIYETEVSFDSIVASLKANKITKITENDFRSWASEDEYDWCNYQGGGCARKQTLSPNPSVLEWPLLRSGDVDDIKAVMGEMQSKYREAFLKQEIEEKFTNFPTFIEKIKSINDQRQPMAIGEIPLYSFYPIDEYREILGNDVYRQALELYNKGELVIAKQEVPHAIIALKTEKIDTPYLNYNIETLDPTPESERFGDLKNLQCQMRNFYLWNDEAKEFRKLLGYLCDWMVDDISSIVYVMLYDAGYPTDTLRTAFNNHCRTNSQSKICQERGTNMSLWLKNNYPKIGNFASDENPGGNCYGLVDFILRTTYLGDFVGEGLRPKK